jgi:hypothetical protein
VSNQLPFVIQPRRERRTIGSEEEGQGVIEIPVYGKIRLMEKLWIREELFANALLAESARLAEAMLEADARLEQRLYEVVGEADQQAIRIVAHCIGSTIELTPEEMVAIQQHASLCTEIKDRLNGMWQEQRIRTITALIRFRLQGCSTWEDEDTLPLADEIQQQILRLADDEAAAESPPQPEEEVLSDLTEKVGKLAAALLERAEAAKIGASSTGDTDGSGPSAATPALSASPGSPPPRSSRRSKKASD